MPKKATTTRKRRASPEPEVKTSAQWIESTVTSFDSANGRTLNSSSPLAQYVGRAQQYILICAQLNARVCAAQRLRLYRPARGDASGKPKAIAKDYKGRQRLAYMQDFRRVGRKAAEYAGWAEEIEEVTEHPALDLLRRPNPWQTGAAFVELSYLCAEVTGNAFWYVYVDGAPEFYIMLPQYTRVMPSETECIAGYEYSRDRANPMVVPYTDCLHYKLMDSVFDPYYGLSPMQAAILEADLSASATAAEGYRWQNGGRPDYVIQTKGPVTPVQRKEMAAELRREVKGVKKTGEFLLLSNAEVKVLGFAPKEMEYIAGLQRCDEVVWAAYGVPQSVMKMNDANLASSVTGNRQYLAQTVQPRCARFAEFLTERMLPGFGIEPGEAWFCYDEVVPQDEAADVDRRIKLTNAGHMTLNESRAIEGLDPYEPDVGDVPRFNGQPITAPQPVPAPLAEAMAGDDEEPEPKPEPEPEPEDEPRTGDGVGEAEPKRFIPLWPEFKAYGHVHDHKSENLTDAPTGYDAIVADFSKRLEAWYRQAIGQAAGQAGGGGAIIVGGHLEKQLQELCAAYIAEIYRVSGEAGLRQIGMAADTFVVPTSVLNFLDTYKVRLASAITEDLQVSLTNVIRMGVEQGMTTAEVSAMIEAESPALAGYRAERIARTETSNAYSQGRLAAWEDAGVEQKDFILSGNPCPLCVAIRAEFPGPIPIGQPYIALGDSIAGYTETWQTRQAPPFHTNCTCAGVAVLGEPKIGAEP